MPYLTSDTQSAGSAMLEADSTLCPRLQCRVAPELEEGVAGRPAGQLDERPNRHYAWVTDSEDETLSLLRDSIRTELQVTNGMASLGLTDEALDELADCVLDGIDQGFDVRWNPKWVANGAPHIWSEGTETFARCTQCLAVSPATSSQDEARGWFAEHQVSHRTA